MTPRAYIATFASISLAGLAVIAALGLIVDGYGVFGTRLIPASHFPTELRLMKRWDRVTKAIEIAERHGDQVLFLGDSRTQHGFDPDSPALGGMKGYNGGLGAATLAEQVIVLDYALAHEPTIKHIFWGLSFETFPFGVFEQTDYADSAFAGRSILSGLALHLFAYDHLISTWKALLQARRQVRAPTKRNGVVTVTADPVEGPSIVRNFESELVATSRNISGPLAQDAIDAAHLQLTQRLKGLKAAGMDVDLVIVPMYIWRLEYLRLIGIEAQSDPWKRRLAAMVRELSAAPGTGKIRLFDFARPHPFVEQSIFVPPPPGERRNYVETNHFYPWFGDKILARVFAKGEDVEVTPAAEPFGREIGQGPDSSSVDSDIATARAALDLWESLHADEVGRIRQLVGR